MFMEELLVTLCVSEPFVLEPRVFILEFSQLYSDYVGGKGAYGI